MDIELYDYNNTPLECLYQWDCNITLKISGVPTSSTPVCHFANFGKDIAYVVPCNISSNKVVTKVPNIVLEQPLCILAYLVYSQSVGTQNDPATERRTKYAFKIPLRPRAMPEEYTYTENIDYTNWIELTEEARQLMTQMEQAKTAANNAASAANTAKTNANNAATSANNAATAATTAKTNADAATTAANNAASAANTAKTKANNAATAANNAATAATTAKTNADAATTAANNAASAANTAASAANTAATAATSAAAAAQEISDYYGSPLVAHSISDMAQTNRIYVYVGSESGYTYGNWYYYNGTAWVSGGTYCASVSDGIVMTDTSDNKMYKLCLKLIDGEPVIEGTLIE
jgi:hypothetical protein